MPYEAQFSETVLMRGHKGDMIDAYLARPFGAGPCPGVVVIHHMPGWDIAHKEIARRFAHHGFVATLPNLHFREGKATPEENSASVRAAGGMPDDRTMGDVQGAIDSSRWIARTIARTRRWTAGRRFSPDPARACARCGRSVWWPALISDRARRVTMTARRTLASIFIIALALNALAAPLAAQPAGTLLVGLVAEPVNLDPAQVTDLNSNRVGRRVVETLVTFPDESTQVVPGLAESWTISKDGLQYTFKLTSGVKFHDGTPLNAEAVKFSIERQINTEHPAYKLGKYPFANYFFGNVKAVEVLSAERVAFLLKEPRASFLAVLTAGAASIVSPTAVMKWGPDYPSHPVGTGPFRFASWDRGQRVVLEKNPAYWKYPVKLERVIYRPIVEDQARLTELLTGGLDLIVGVPADFVTQLEQNPKMTLLKQTGAHVWYLGINNQKKPFDDKRVRQALNYAVNKDAIVRDVLKGTGTLSKGPVLPGTWGADGGIKAYPYDPEKAKKLLAEAGYPNGFTTTMWVPESGSGMQAPVAMSTVMQSNLKAVGVNVSLQTMEWGAYLTKLRTKEQELFALSWMAGTEDPDMVMYPLLHSSQWTPVGPNRAQYKNARFDELLLQARLTTDQAKRAALYREAQRILVDDAPWVFIDHEIQIAAFAKRVQGFKLHPSFDLRVETISLK